MQIKLFDKDQGLFVFQLDQDNYIKFCPERGGVITNWVSDGKEILYLDEKRFLDKTKSCLLYTSPSPRDLYRSRMPSSA